MENNLLLEQYSWYKKQQLAESPFKCLLNADIEPNPHQVNAFCAAIQALKTGGIILADEVGLGKTIEAGLVLNYVLDNGAKKVLIALPATLRKQWEVELSEKFGHQAVILDRYTVEHDSADVRGHLENNAEISIVITSYDYSSKLMKRFPHVKWDFLIIDEAHNLRNVFHGTKRAKNLYDLTHGIPKILLTATPLQNSLTDLHGLVSFIDPRIFGSEKVFNRRFVDGGDYEELKQELQPVLYRTLRRDVGKYMFDNNRLGEIRPNQLITTFGPGSIVDAVKDSVTVLDLNYWKEKGKKIIDGRLAAYLGVDCFYMPRTSYSGDIPVVSFPYMHVCSNVKCGKIFDVRENFDLERYLKFGVTCPVCHKQAYPSRFITICENGHMHDFPWSWWVHNGNTTCKGTMRMYSTGNTSTLADMWVECSCGARRSMMGATQRENFEGMKCSGHHPFRPNHKNEKCDKDMIPSQRGASNVYFPVMRSAISIPPWINPLYNLIDEHLRDIELAKTLMGDDGVAKIYELYFGAYAKDEFDAALERRQQNIKEFTEIKQMEYNAITHHADPVYASNKKHFKAEEDPLPTYLLSYFRRIIRITRLREVRVLLGFTRVDAPDPDADEQTNIVYLNKGKTEKWLPAAEVHGEGIFIEFNRDTIDAWMGNPEVAELSQKYAQCYKEFCESKEWTVTTLRDARYVLMHTFAHLLIKQMSMSSGYSSSAIRERIYFGDDMSGVLLYTGSADKEGSLGGLVELGNIDQLIVLMKDAFQEALVCTNDPECLNNIPAGNNSNGAACHSCCMISETACENGNRMLDRGLIVPIDGREEQSYFKTLVEELCQLEV